jgi:hypothetical protein
MANYYFVISSLPPLAIGLKPELSFKELKEMLILNLNPEDLRRFDCLLWPIDLYNLRAFWTGLPLDERGSKSSKEFEEALLVGADLPSYLIDFLEKYGDVPERLRNFSSLFVSLYRNAQPLLDGFLLKYYQFQREVRLILTALRAKRSGRDVVRELQFEDPFDPLVAQILAQKDATDYSPPSEYEDLKLLFLENGSDPEKLHRAFLEYQFSKIEEMEESWTFGIDRILAYTARLLLVESWNHLDREKGTITVEQLSQYG